MNKLFLLIIFILSSLIGLRSQVTIGSPNSPNEGALLDLKENNNLGSNSTKGLLLPRVSLVSKTSLKPLTDTKSTAEMEAYNGIIVYNTKPVVANHNCSNEINEKESMFSGFSVWDGKEWHTIGYNIDDFKDKIEYVEDNQGNKYIINSFKEAGTWMCENLRTTVFPPSYNKTLERWSSPIALDDYFASTVYGYPQKERGEMMTDPTDYNEFPAVGLLYSPGAVFVQGGAPGQGICPTGWHIPSEEEWDLLMEVIKRDADEYTYSDPSIISNPVGFVSGLIVSSCNDFAPDPFKRSLSKSALQGGFAFIFAGWGDCIRGDIINNKIFEIAESGVKYLAGSLIESTYNSPKHRDWNGSQMISVRCKKN